MDPAMTQFMILNKCLELKCWCRQMFLTLTLKLTAISFESDEEARARATGFTFILFCGVRKIGFCRWIEDKGDEESLCNYKTKTPKCFCVPYSSQNCKAG